MNPPGANPTYDFEGQVALVTGASSGMGLATARAFAEHGASVAFADINEDALRAATDELTAAGHQALSIPCDVSDEDQVAALVDRTVATFGRLDMAVQQRRDHDPAKRRRQMRAQGSGAIVNCSSLVGSSGSPAAPRTTPPSTA